MRNAILATLVLLLFGLQGVHGQDASTKTPQAKESINADTIRLGQMDGTIITLVGIGSFPLAYTETLDGYTVVLNKVGIYEYAKQSKDGDLVPTGTKANNPDKRDKKEKKYAARLTPHLRYKSPKLNVLLQKHDKLNITPKKEKK